MNINSKTILLNLVAIASSTVSIASADPKTKYDLDEKIIAYRLNKIQTAFDKAIDSNEIKKNTIKLTNDIYNFYNLAFHEAKKHLANKGKAAASQYLTILKDTAQKLEDIFTSTPNQPVDMEKIAGIIFLCAFKAHSLADAEPSLDNCFNQLLSCTSLAQPLCRIAQDAIILLITLAENAQKHLSPDDIKLFKLTENIAAMKTIAKLFDGNFRSNIIKAHIWGTKISQQKIVEIILFWTSLAPVYVTLEKQIIEHNVADILHHMATMTDGFIAQLG